jgi:hypothetical protein
MPLRGGVTEGAPVQQAPARGDRGWPRGSFVRRCPGDPRRRGIVAFGSACFPVNSYGDAAPVASWRPVGTYVLRPRAVRGSREPLSPGQAQDRTRPGVKQRLRGQFSSSSEPAGPPCRARPSSHDAPGRFGPLGHRPAEAFSTLAERVRSPISGMAGAGPGDPTVRSRRLRGSPVLPMERRQRCPGVPSAGAPSWSGVSQEHAPRVIAAPIRGTPFTRQGGEPGNVRRRPENSGGRCPSGSRPVSRRGWVRAGLLVEQRPASPTRSTDVVGGWGSAGRGVRGRKRPTTMRCPGDPRRRGIVRCALRKRAQRTSGRPAEPSGQCNGAHRVRLATGVRSTARPSVYPAEPLPKPRAGDGHQFWRRTPAVCFLVSPESRRACAEAPISPGGCRSTRPSHNPPARVCRRLGVQDGMSARSPLGGEERLEAGPADVRSRDLRRGLLWAHPYAVGGRQRRFSVGLDGGVTRPTATWG